MSGEPHALTFDEVRYDLQAAGEFVAVQSLEDSLEIQVRLEPLAGDVQASIVTAAAARLGEHRLMISMGSEAPLRIDGMPMELGTDEYALFEDGGGVVRTGSRYSVVWPDGTNLHVDLFRRHLNVYVLASESRDGRLTGLLGDADGDGGGNDFRLPDGKALASPPEFESLYRVFAESWRVRTEQSLFDYDKGQNTETFTIRSFPSHEIKLGELDATSRAQAEESCRSAGVTDEKAFEQCVYDVSLTSDNDYIASALSLQKPIEFGEEEGQSAALESVTSEGITLRVPREVITAFPIEFQVSGATKPGDMIAIARKGAADSERLTGERVRAASEDGTLRLVGRNESGSYEVRYLSEESGWREARVRLPFEARDPNAHLEAPETVPTGGEVTVRCEGECSPLAYITVVPAGSRDDALGTYGELKNGRTVTIRDLPKEAGEYEIRYLAPRNPRRVFARKVIRLD
ncbi:MAG: VWD domain-containing protein [Acidobacteriota bacterium]|nr:MAG: VWD domain-containing protein [Acidobacteriota bacterium]